MPARDKNRAESCHQRLFLGFAGTDMNVYHQTDGEYSLIRRSTAPVHRLPPNRVLTDSAEPQAGGNTVERFVRRPSSGLMGDSALILAAGQRIVLLIMVVMLRTMLLILGAEVPIQYANSARNFGSP